MGFYPDNFDYFFSNILNLFMQLHMIYNLDSLFLLFFPLSFYVGTWGRVVDFLSVFDRTLIIYILI